MQHLVHKISFFGILLILSSNAFGKVTDTISFWHIDYNQTTILELSQGMEGHLLTIDTDSLGEDDLLGIKYWAGCLVCSDCPTHIGIYNQNKKLIQHEDAKGPFTPIVINFREILLQFWLTGESVFDCYYLEGNDFEPERAVHVLRIQLE